MPALVLPAMRRSLVSATIDSTLRRARLSDRARRAHHTSTDARRMPRMSEPTVPSGPDLTRGVAADTLADGGMIAGHVGEAAVLLVRSAGEFFALDATCTHYGGPLADGLVVGDTVRCP